MSAALSSRPAALAPPQSTTAASSASSSSSHQSSLPAPTAQTTDTKPSESALQAPDISSPHQLIDWVDTVLGQLETRFDEMNGQVTARMNEMSTRIDALESSIQDLIHGTLAPAQGEA